MCTEKLEQYLAEIRGYGERGCALCTLDNTWIIRSKYRYFGVLAGPIRLRTAGGFWDLVFPDHCSGDEVFHAGLVAVREAGRWYYSPVIYVLCGHWEYGDTTDELAMLDRLAELVRMEAFPAAGSKLAYVVLMSWIHEFLFMIIRPQECFEDAFRDDTYLDATCLFKTPGKAIRRFNPNIREQIRECLSSKNWIEPSVLFPRVG